MYLRPSLNRRNRVNPRLESLESRQVLSATVQQLATGQGEHVIQLNLKARLSLAVDDPANPLYRHFRGYVVSPVVEEVWRDCAP